MDNLTVLFAGATGRFRPLTDLLLARGHRVLAGTRHPTSARARQLAEQGAQIVPLDFDDPADLVAAAERADALIAGGTAHAAGPAADVRHGRTIIDAAHASGIAHLVYLTVAGADRRTGVPVMDSKFEVEQFLRAAGVPHTIIAPVYFMENLWNPWNARVLATGRLPIPVSRSRSLQQVALADVLAFAVHALERDPVGERVEIASDELTPGEAAAAVSRLVGRRVEVADPATLASNPLFAWLERVGTDVDIAALHARYPKISWHSFADWAAEQDWRRHGLSE